jgi:hypothetical protein
MNIKIISKESTIFEGRTRIYDVVDKNLGIPCPKYFVSYNQGSPFISQEVPQNFRKYMIYHELYEFEEFDPKDEDSCLESLRKELAKVPYYNLQEHVDFRKDTFRHLIEFVREYDKDSFQKINRSLNYLENLTIK